MLAELLTCLILTPAPQAPQGVVINEFAYDDSGADNYEFIELYNGGSTTVDISGWILVGEEGTSGGAPNGTLTIPAATILAPGQFWLIGGTNIPGANQALGTVLRMENGPDGLLLTDAASVPQDGVVWEYANWTAAAPAWLEGDGLGGDIQLHEHANNFNSISRCIDGVDTDDNGCDFRSAPWTPGTFNVTGYTTTLPYENNFDDAVGSLVDNDYVYSFTPGNTQDPAAVQTAIISGIPQPTQSFAASPQGGNISVWHDPTGGGNANWLKNFPINNYVMEAYVYVTGPNASFDADDGEAWVMGVRGCSDSFGEFSNVGGFPSLISCSTNTQTGHTGIAWVCLRTQTISDLYLVDFNNSGGDFTILAGPIAVQAGVNDGWQRFRIYTQGGDVVGNFGGTLGCDDGQRFTATNATQCNNGVYFTYRECVSDNNMLLPLMMDALTITESTMAATVVSGTGAPSSAGVPIIGNTGLPVIGNAAFAVTGSSMVPNGNPFCGLLVQLGTPLPGIQIPGAQIGALQYVNPQVSLLGFANASGNVNFGLGTPCGTGFAGIQMAAQLVDLDVSLPDSLPIGTSPALTITLGF